MSWDENEKYVLEKLEFLERVQAEANQDRKKEHKDLLEYVRKTNERVEGKIDLLRDNLQSDVKDALKEQDSTDKVARITVIQHVLVGTVLVILNVIFLLHFDMKLPF